MSKHLTHQDILLMLDGELSLFRRYSDQRHVRACWACRSEVERLKSDIAILVDAQNEVFLPSIVEPPASWRPLGALLETHTLKRSRPGWVAALKRHQMKLALAIPVVAVSIAIVPFLRVRPVSAKEIMVRVQAAETGRESISQGQFIRQRLRISKRSKGRLTQESGQMDVWKSNAATYWDLQNNEEAGSDLSAEYKSHHIPLTLPLSPTAVGDWIQVAGGEPVVTRQGDDLRLNFGSSDSPNVTRVQLLVQSDEWKVKQMTLEISGDSYEVSEENFSIVSTNEVPHNLLAILEPAQAVPVPVRATMASVTVPLVPESLLIQTELDVRVVLHQLNADMGEPVMVDRSKREVNVGIWQLPEDRQRQIEAALKDMKNVSVQTDPKAGQLVFANDVEPVSHIAPMDVSSRVTAVPSSPEELKRMTLFLGGTEEEQIFVRTVLAKSTQVLSHVYAIHNIEQRFSPREEEALPEEDRVKLRSLVKDHAEMASAALSDLQNDMAPLNAIFSVNERDMEPGSQLDSATSQDEADRALTEALYTDHLLRGFLTTNATPLSPAAALPELQQQFSRLAVQVDALKN